MALCCYPLNMLAYLVMASLLCSANATSSAQAYIDGPWRPEPAGTHDRSCPAGEHTLDHPVAF